MLGPIQELAGKIGSAVINPLIALIFGAGLVVFIWGLVQYLYALNIQGRSSEEGVKHMIWGIVGMFIMVAAFTIIRLIAGTINVQLPPGY